MRDGSSINQGRNTYRRGGLGDWVNEIEAGIPVVNIGGLFDDKS